jgi:tetratricopeptide (TPR) repeat protein
MTEIALRTYNQEIKDLIDHGHFDEAIAHCQHILETYPRHIETYRLLGKAFLEQGRHGDAADVFQRVLSAIPEDWLSHVAMAIVREDESNLDMAIWHMERAYEVNPSNPTVQQEVRRLRGRRDGVEPPKLRLTRSALARMYIKGGLFGQAIAEIRSALAEDADRPDLQTLLASALFESGAVQEATEICSTILQKLPYCLEANRILGLALWASDKKEDAEKLFQRLESLDPYIDIDTLKKDKRIQEHPGQSVTLTRIEWEQQEKTVRSGKQPAWASSLGLKIEEPQGRPAIPDWLATASQPAAPATPAAIAAAAPFGGPTPSWFNDAANAIGTGKPAGTSQLGSPNAPVKSPAVGATKTGTGELPDWIKTQSGPVETPAAVKPSGPLPDWLAAPSAPPASISTPAASSTESTLPDWIRSAAPASTAPSEKVAGIPDWLSAPPPASVEALPSSSLPEWTKPETKTGPLEVEPGNIPDWLSSSAPAAIDAGSEPEWLKPAPAASAAPDSVPEWMKVVSPAETPMASQPVMEKVPDWLQESPAAPSKPVEIIPEWMRSETPAAPEARKEKLPTPFGPETEIPEWMKPEATETPAVPAPIKPAPIPEPDFSSRNVAPEPVKPAAVQEKVPEIGLPDWMTSAAPSAAVAPQPVPAPAPVQPVESAPEITPEVTLPDWLTGVAPSAPAGTAAASPASMPAPEERIRPPVQAQSESVADVTIPDWLRDAAPPASAAPAPAAVQPKPEPQAERQPEPSPEIYPEVELPDWLTSVVPPTPAAATPDQGAAALAQAAEQLQTPGEATPEVALPDWLKGVASSTPTIPTPASPPIASPAPAPIAAAPEPAPITPSVDAVPEAIPEVNLPDWIKTSAPSAAPAAMSAAPAAPIIEPEPKPSAAVQAAPAMPLPAAVQPPEEPPPSELDLMGSSPISEGIDLPDWLVAQLKGKSAEPAPNPAAAKPAVPMPDWLKPSTQNLPPTPVVDWEKAAGQPVPSIPADATRPATGATPPADRAASGSGDIPAWLDKSKPSGNETVARWLDRRLKTSTLSSLEDATTRGGPKPPAQAPSPTARPAQSSTQLPTWLDSQKPGGSDTVVRWMDKRETGSLRRTPTSAFADAGKTAFPAAAGTPAAKPEAPQAPAPAKPSTGGLGTEDTIGSKRPAAPEAPTAVRPISEQPRPALSVPAPMSPEQAMRTPHLAKLATGGLGTEATLAARKPAPTEEEEEDGGFVPPPEWLQKALGSAVEDVPPIPKPQAPVPETPKPQSPVRASVEEQSASVRWQPAAVEEPAPVTTAKPAPWVPIATPKEAPEAPPKPVKKAVKKKTRKLTDVESEALIREARVYLDSDLQKASEAYQKVIENPASAEVVAGDLTSYLEQDPASPQLWNLLGDACSRAGRFQDAYRAYAEALRRM